MKLLWPSLGSTFEQCFLHFIFPSFLEAIDCFDNPTPTVCHMEYIPYEDFKSIELPHYFNPMLT